MVMDHGEETKARAEALTEASEAELRRAVENPFCKFFEGDVRRLLATLDAARAERDEARRALDWEDMYDQWTPAIQAAHPTRGGSHEHYATGMQMVGHRHSKGQLVSLVCWLLTRAATAEAQAEAMRRALTRCAGLECCLMHERFNQPDCGNCPPCAARAALIAATSPGQTGEKP